MDKIFSALSPEVPEVFKNIPIKRSSRRKHISIKMRPDGSCELLIPLSVSDIQLHKAMEHFAPWIEKQQKKLSRQLPSARPCEFAFAIGSNFYYCGQAYELKLLQANGSQIISFRDNALWSASADPAAIQKMMENFYRRQTRRLVTGLLEKYAEKFNISYGEISINGARRRFGSCNSKGDLNFSWLLAMYPLNLIELVVLHELSHRSEMNHSARFYKVLSNYLPDHRERDRELKLWSRKLALYPA